MTREATDTDYVLARIHARHGMRADEVVWSRLAAFQDYRGYLQALSGTPLAPFVVNLQAAADIHMIERRMRAAWRDYVSEVAGWHDKALCHAIGQLADLPDLPARGYLARGEPAPGWLEAPDRSMAKMPPADGPVLDTWRTAFLQSLPDRGTRRAAEHVLDHLIAAGDGGVPPAPRLRTVGHRLFRRMDLPFARVLAHLACVAGDLLELRSALCVRIALGAVHPQGEPP